MNQLVTGGISVLNKGEFIKKQILVYEPFLGDKMSYKNDNMVIRDGNGKIKYQVSCYRIFMVLIVGDVTITTGILRRQQKFGFRLCFLTLGLKVYSVIGPQLQWNTLLHCKQYAYDELTVGKSIIINKILNQRAALTRLRSKTEDVRECISLLEQYSKRLQNDSLNLQEIIGIEGMASKIYFPRIFSNTQWIGRKPRIKFDYINTLLDIGYNALFNFIDAILQVFGFDVYYGVLHTCFYMRKSLVCDIMEPMRPIVDWQIRKSINLKQFKQDDFVQVGKQYQLKYKKSTQYLQVFLEAILNYKEEIFVYVRDYYRSFMKNNPIEAYPVFKLEEL